MSPTANAFPYLDQVAKESGIPAVNLVRVFELEKQFHDEILATSEAQKRKQQYSELYNTIHPLLKRTDNPGVICPAFYQRLVLLFKRELTGKSVLDVGCGTGQFLLELEKLLPHGDLWGLDTSAAELPSGSSSSVKFVQHDVTSFRLDRSFDVVFSHQVLEHIAPEDFASHIESIHAALKPGGKFIVALPNKHWGPHDITMIVDNTCTGRVAAAGSHLNESSYTEMIPLLEGHGFERIHTIVPFAGMMPPVRGVRVRPWFNRFIERSRMFRTVANLFRISGKPIFKNHVVLICNKPRQSGYRSEEKAGSITDD